MGFVHDNNLCIENITYLLTWEDSEKYIRKREIEYKIGIMMLLREGIQVLHTLVLP
jgi:hypothetical protein